MTTPSISVVIPTYNRARYIGEAVESVLNQSPAPREVIVVDDGSTDNTERILNKYGDAITYIRQANAGASVARNTGIRAAKSDWVAFLDSDDVWLPGYVACQMERIQRYPGAQVHATNVEIFCTDGLVENVFEKFGLAGYFRTSDTLLLAHPFAQVLDHYLFFLPSLLIYRKLLLESGLMRTDLSIGEDVELLARLALRTPFSVCNRILVNMHHRRGDSESVSRVVQASGISSCETFLRVFLSLRDLAGLQKSDQKRLAKALAGNRRQIGNLFLRINDLPKARRAFRQAVSYHPSLASLLKYLASFAPPVARILDRRGHHIKP